MASPCKMSLYKVLCSISLILSFKTSHRTKFCSNLFSLTRLRGRESLQEAFYSLPEILHLSWMSVAYLATLCCFYHFRVCNDDDLKIRSGSFQIYFVWDERYCTGCVQVWTFLCNSKGRIRNLQICTKV